jgi:hypothetical protein
MQNNITSGISESIGSIPDDSVGSVSDISEKIGIPTSDPIGPILQKPMFLVNQLISTSEIKILELIEDVKKTQVQNAIVNVTDSKININSAGADKLYSESLKRNIDSKFTSINNILSKINTVINTLNVIKNIAIVYIRLIDVKEAFLKINPAPTFPGPTLGAVYLLAKQAVSNSLKREKILEYITLIGFLISQNKLLLNNLTNQVRELNTIVKIQDEANKGSFIDTNQAESMIAGDKLGTDVSLLSKDYTADNGKEYILKIEKYGDKQLIGRAYFKDTGFIKEQTAPSFVSSPDQLYTELQEILNLNINY